MGGRWPVPLLASCCGFLMVHYFNCELVSPPYIIYMGADKHENDKLIRWGWPEDVWFHVDKLSSAHVYLRLREGETLDDVPEAVIQDCAQLCKHNSIMVSNCTPYIRKELLIKIRPFVIFHQLFAVWLHGKLFYMLDNLIIFIHFYFSFIHLYSIPWVIHISCRCHTCCIELFYEQSFGTLDQCHIEENVHGFAKLMS